MKPLRTIAVASPLPSCSWVKRSLRPHARSTTLGVLTGPARSATAKYHSLTVAKKAGYSILADTAGITCIADPGWGQGVHYVRAIW